jgi:hypothetical protein
MSLVNKGCLYPTEGNSKEKGLSNSWIAALSLKNEQGLILD